MAPNPRGDIRFLRRVLIVAAVVALALLAWYLIDVLLLVFGAVLIAVLLRALANPIARRTPLPDTWALIPATLGILLVVGLAVWLLGAEVRAEIAELADRLPDAWRSFEERLGATDLGERIINRAQDAAPGAGSVVSGLAGVVTSFVGGLADFLLIVFGGLYLAAQPGLYRGRHSAAVPGRRQPRANRRHAGCKRRGATPVAARSAGLDDVSLRADRAGLMGDRRAGGAGARPAWQVSPSSYPC